MMHHGDLFDVLPTLAAESIDAGVTDPPYGIGFMGKKWDSFKPGEAEKRIVTNHAIESDNPNLKGRTRSPASSPSAVEYDRGLAGQREFQAWTEAWAREVYRVLKPGGYLLVCGAPRSFHRMTCGLEDAGFEIRDCLSWLYGSGFPKSLNISKAIDKAGGMSPREQSALLRQHRETSGLSRDDVAARVGCTPSSVRDWEEGRARETGASLEWIVPSDQYRSLLADLLGYSADEREAIGVTTDRRGDGSVIGLGHSGTVYSDATTDAAKLWMGWGTALKPGWEPIIVARKPVRGTVSENVLTHGTGGLNIDACRIQGGPSVGGDSSGATALGQGSGWNAHENRTTDIDRALEAGRWPANVVMDDAAAAMLDAQTGLTESVAAPRGGTSPNPMSWGTERADGDKLAGFNDSGGASRFYYVAKPSREERDYGCGARNSHPTVKPIELMRWLVKLVTPPNGTVLDPFTGSGTTGMACRYEQRQFVGVEREADYVTIAKARIAAVAPLFS